MTADSKDSADNPFGIPGAGNLHEVMDSMQKAWGFNSATPMTPTLDIDEIDRRLQDLNTISQWLSLNQNMLQSTIQTLQVQRATLAAIQSFGTAAQDKGEEGAVSPMDVMQAFTRMFAAPQSDPATGTNTETEANPAPGSAAPAPGPRSSPAASADPQQWWTMLQNQFAQVASAALDAQKTPSRSSTSSKSAAKKSAGSRASRKSTKPKST